MDSMIDSEAELHQDSVRSAFHHTEQHNRHKLYIECKILPTQRCMTLCFVKTVKGVWQKERKNNARFNRM